MSTPSYFLESSTSSLASKKDGTDIDGTGSTSNKIQNGLNTIERSTTISTVPQRKYSDDSSLGKIQPVHNLFGQQQYSPYDSDGSDGSLVFSPGSIMDDHKTASGRKDNLTSASVGSGPGAASDPAVANICTYKKKRYESTFLNSNRDRIPSVDSNGSVRYIHSSQNSPVNTKTSVDIKHNQNHVQSQQQSQQHMNPHMLPYHERRKLVQQRQYQEQNQHLMYHDALAQTNSQSSQTQHQNQYSSPNPPNPTHPINPRMAAAYYQMYGIPPPGVYTNPLPPHSTQHQSGNLPAVGYTFPPEQLGATYYHPQIPTAVTAAAAPHSMPHPHVHQSVHQFQHQNSSSGFHPQQYPSSQVSGHTVTSSFSSPYHHHPGRIPPTPPQYISSVAPQFTYMPPIPVLSSNNNSPDQLQKQQHQQQQQQQEKQPREQQQQQSLKPPHPRLIKHDRSNTSANDTTPAGATSHIVGANKSQLPSSVVTNNAKNNPPRPPTGNTSRRSGNNSGLHRNILSSGSIPPPPPPPLSGGSSYYSGGSSNHSRADSYGSMSSLGSHGPVSTSFSKDEEDDCPPQSTQSSNQHHGNQRSLYIDSRKESNSFTPPPPTLTPKSNRLTIDSSAAVTTPETPQRQVRSQHARKHSFLDMLRMGWSPQSRDSPSAHKKPNINEFHRKNQEFLNRATVMSQSPTSSNVPLMHHRRVGSQDRPPASRGTHRRLQSISNDEWDDGDGSHRETDVVEENIKNHVFNRDQRENLAIKIKDSNRASTSDEMSDNGNYTDEDRITEDEGHDESDNDESDNVDENSSLLPPSGISSNEKEGKDSKYDRKYRRGHLHYESTSSTRRHHHPNESTQLPSCTSLINGSIANISKVSESAMSTTRRNNRTINMDRKSRKKKYRHKNSKHLLNSDTSSESSQDSSDSSFDHRKWTKKRARILEKERAKLIEQWKVEAKEEAELLKEEEESNRWYRRSRRTILDQFHNFGTKAFRCFTLVENFIGNLPLTIGAVALAIVTLGVVWLKFAEEYLDTCEPVHFQSNLCTFPEFPGCFHCDTSSLGYKVAICFHYTCTVVSGLLAMLLVAKILLATRVVMDEMSSPTTSSPAGLLCMTAVCVFAGRGMVGQIIVSTAAFIHLGLAIWFIYMALAYNIMPEPSWFPNTIGIGLSAVKIWLYYPMPGHLLMAISLSLNFFFFPISLIRVVVNKKISATVAWMQMSAPAVSLYALTIMAQPSSEEEEPDATNFQHMHRMFYLPCMHIMCALSLLGMAASIHSLWDRWPDFSIKEFSPAHVAFCFPTLSHANSIQAYRGAVMAFSDIPPRSWRMFILDTYWIIVLVGGTAVTVCFCSKFIYMLPEWTSPDLSNEEEPPAPYDTLLSQQHMVTAGDSLTQSFVSPAILQANETGALVLSRSARDGTLRYVRTRRVRALGFEPTMNWSEMLEEEDVLLDYVGKNPPRRRHRTLSVPGIDFNYGSSQPAFGTNNTGIYGSYSHTNIPPRRRSLSQGENSSIFPK